MAIAQERIQSVEIEEEVKLSYLDYAMSVIVSRALPDVRDGLKPVQRRVLYTMYELGLLHNRPYKKCARIVGETLGKYHPHGDAAVYETLVRLAQDFTMRYPLVDGQGNFGSIDGDSPAAMRYTEARLSEIAEEMLHDIQKNTVDFRPNFDETLKEPEVLPTILPNLLVNGASGIAVGMATSIPPHNLSEIVDGLIALIKNPGISNEKLMRYVKGPDFPTGGIIVGYEGIKEAYTKGKGRVTVRARANIETYKGRSKIIITEIPYQVNKSALIEKIAELVNRKVIEDISDIRDESDKDGMRIVIELKKDAQPSVVLNNLYKHTNLQTTFSVIMLSLVNGVPRILTLKEMMQEFIKFRLNVIVRRTRFELDDAEKRAHILEGYKIALDHIDAIVELIKKSKDPNTAKEKLKKKFKLSEVQAKAILDMRLQRLTSLERHKIDEEYKETIKLIEKLKGILKNKQLQYELIKQELLKLKEKYGDERRTDIIEAEEDFSIEDLIAKEDVVITITHNGFIKRYPVSGYRRQARGTKGITAAMTKDDDFVEHMFVSSTHNYILFFTDKGRAYGLKVHEIPEGSRASRGKSIAYLLNKGGDEKITAYVSVKDFSDDYYLTMVTKHGFIKKVPLSEFSNAKRNGIIAINLERGDRLVEVKLTDGNQDLIIGTANGMAIRFNEREVRPMGRQATGVRAIKLDKGDEVVGMLAIKRSGTTVLVVTQKGYGKRSDVGDYRSTHRGGKGIITVKVTERTGKMISIKEVIDEDDIMIVTAKGLLVRQKVKSIRVMGRAAQGVKLIKLNPGDSITSVASVVNEED